MASATSPYRSRTRCGRRLRRNSTTGILQAASRIVLLLAMSSNISAGNSCFQVAVSSTFRSSMWHRGGVGVFLSPQLRVASTAAWAANNGSGNCSVNVNGNVNVNVNGGSLAKSSSTTSTTSSSSTVSKSSIVDDSSQTFDRLLQHQQKNYPLQQRRARQKSKAPLVDSNLLRFLSYQKYSSSTTVSQNDTKDEQWLWDVQDDITNGERPSNLLKRRAGNIIQFNPDGEQDQAFEAESIPVDPTYFYNYASETVNENQPLWFSQYNAQRIAMMLQDLGVDESTSRNTGKIVQDYVVTRITRRRIRMFLQERDSSWQSTSDLPRANDNDGSKHMAPSTSSTFNLDAVIAVLREYGLTGADIAVILSHTPSISMMAAKSGDNDYFHGNNSVINAESKKWFTLQTALDRSLIGLLGNTLKLRRYDARKVLRSCPGLLTSKGAISAEQVVKIMLTLGSSTNAMARDKASLPILLSRSPALLFRLVAFLSSTHLKVPLTAIGPILRQKRSIEILDAVVPLRHAPYRDSACAEIVSGSLSNTVIKTKLVGDFNIDSTIRQRQIDESYQSMETVANVMRKYGGINDFSKILSSYPHFLFLNVTNVISVTTFLRDDIGMTLEDVAKSIESFPTLLEHDVSKLKNVVEFLFSIEVSKDSLPSILRSFPATLLLDPERNLIPVVEFLRSIGVQNIGRFVTRLPPVLGYSVENELMPKWNFLKEVCQFDYFEVVRFPAYFSYPFERVIKMRYSYLRDRKQIPIQLVRVDDVLRFGDRDFATEIALDDDNGSAFAKYVEENSSTWHSTIRIRQKRKKNKSIIL